MIGFSVDSEKIQKKRYSELSFHDCFSITLLMQMETNMKQNTQRKALES
jgi:hypothetical protein